MTEALETKVKSKVSIKVSSFNFMFYLAITISIFVNWSSFKANWDNEFYGCKLDRN